VKPDDGQLDLERLKWVEAPELHRALGALRQQLPDATQLAALAATLSVSGLPVQPPSAATTKQLSSATRLKLLIGAGVVGPLTLALVLWRAEAARPLAPVSVSSSASQRALPSPSADAQFGVRPTPQAARKAGVGGLASDPDPAIAPLASSSPSELEADTPRAQHGSAQAPPSAAGTDAPKPSGARVRASGAPGADSASGLGPGVVARPTELALLRDARIALRTNPSEALALAEQHRTSFAQGAMVQERELIAISALARLGRHTAVLARAAQFERDFPGSPYRKQISLLAQ